MAAKQSRYKSMERMMTYGLCADAALFILYMIFAGMGIIWLKVILAIFSLLISAAILTLLYLSRELTTRRSQWITAGAAALALCLLLSLILNFPSPNPYKPAKEEKSAFVAECCI